VDIMVPLHHTVDDSGETPAVERRISVTYDTERRCIVGEGVLWTRDFVGHAVSHAVAVLLLEGLPGSAKYQWLPDHVRDLCDRLVQEARENGRAA
jgi:hypothetical protein